MDTSASICHFLIGPPGSGKSTLAAQMCQIIPNSRVVSTDHIRETLYGDESIQGNWPEIEEIILAEIKEAIANHRVVIYDATNARRAWRMGLLIKLADVEGFQWVAWHLKTPLQQCQEWNQKRERQVPSEIIEETFQNLKNFPPLTAEGFIAVYTLNPTQSGNPADEIQSKIERLNRSIVNRANRTQNQQIFFHSYSRLLDFDRLLFLISLLAQYPGLGTLHSENPALLQQILGGEADFQTDLSEICAVLEKSSGLIYADAYDVSKDLEWLENNQFLTPSATTQNLTVEVVSDVSIASHPYSDIEPFKRLLSTIRFILQNPMHWDSELGSLRSLVTAMQQQGIIVGDQTDAIRKDIERVLKPFKILPDFALKRGYFIGTGVLTSSQLTKVFYILQSQAKNLQDPIALEIFEAFEERMKRGKLDIHSAYPVRAICNRTIVDSQLLPQSALARNVEQLEDEIAQGRVLELKRFASAGRYGEDPEDFFRVCPLQIVFHNIGWYLGFEILEGDYQGLLQFERLDRLFRGYPHPATIDTKLQQQSLNKLQKLYQASGGLFLGKDVQAQRKFLGRDAADRATVTIQVELWFNDYAFRFISEGTQRFPISQMKMSPKLSDSSTSQRQASIFTLSKTSDTEHSNRFRVMLPCWSMQDIDLRRWILGFGNTVKVIEPPELATAVADIGKAISALYT
jgi:predicted kinase